MPTEAQWLEASQEVHRATSRLRGPVLGGDDYDLASLRALFARLVAKVPVPDRWTREVRDAVASRCERPDSGGSDYRNERMREMACFRLGHAAVTGDPGWVSRAEACALAPFRLVPTPPSAPTLPPDPGAEVFHVEFCTTFPVRPPRARTRSVPARARSVVPVERVPSRSAPPCLVLGFAGNGASFAVRSFEGRTYRPLFAPGTFAPLDEAGFAAAAEGDDAWADNPFLSVSRDVAAYPIRDYARDLNPSDDDEEAAMSASVAAAAERCGRLISVDGIVHRPSPPVEIHPSWNHDPRNYSVSLEWGLGGLDSRFSPIALARASSHCDRTFGCRLSHHFHEAYAHAFGVDELVLARDVVSLAAKATGWDATECVVSPTTPTSADHARAMAERLRSLSSSRRGSLYSSFLRDPYEYPLVAAARAAEAGDVEALREVYRDWPRHEGYAMASAEREYLRAVIGVAGKAVKGDYGNGDDVDLDVTDFV